MNIVKAIMIFEGVLFLAAFIAIIVLILKRVEERKNETFEKRDN